MNFKRGHELRRIEGDLFLLKHEVRLRSRYRDYYNENNIKALADFETISNSLNRMMKGKKKKLNEIKKNVRNKIEMEKRESPQSTKKNNVVINIIEEMDIHGIDSINEIEGKGSNLVAELVKLEKEYEDFTFDIFSIYEACNLVEELVILNLNKTALESVRDKVLMEYFHEFIGAPNLISEETGNPKNNGPSKQEKENIIEEVASKITGHGLSKYLKKTIEIYLTGFLKKPLISRTQLLDNLLDKVYQDKKKFKEKPDLLIENLERAKKSSVTSGWEENLIERLSLEWPDYAKRLNRSDSFHS